jgi:transposase-like protein
MKRSWAGEVRNVSLLVAIAVNADGYRDILGIVEGAKEDKAGWSGFLKHLKERGLKGVRLIISDACMGLAESAAVLSRRGVATVRGSFLPQRLQPCAAAEDGRGGCDA